MKLKSYFQYSKSQRSGIFLLVLLCVICQITFFYWDPSSENGEDSEKQKWIGLQAKVDSLKVKSKIIFRKFIRLTQILLPITKEVNWVCQLRKLIGF